jgi:hypothetical protein
MLIWDDMADQDFTIGKFADPKQIRGLSLFSWKHVAMLIRDSMVTKSPITTALFGADGVLLSLGL